MAGVGDIVVIIGIFSGGGFGGADETAPNIEFALVIDADHGGRKRQRLRRRVCLTLLKRLDLLRQVLQASLDWFIKHTGASADSITDLNTGGAETVTPL